MGADYRQQQELEEQALFEAEQEYQEYLEVLASGDCTQ